MYISRSVIGLSAIACTLLAIAVFDLFAISSPSELEQTQISSAPTNLHLASRIEELESILLSHEEKISKVVAENERLEKLILDLRSASRAKDDLQNSLSNGVSSLDIESTEPIYSSIAELQQSILNDFFVKPMSDTVTTQLQQTLSGEFSSSPKLLNATLSNIECRESQCLIEITKPIGEFTDDQLFEYQFRLTQVLGANGLRSALSLGNINGVSTFLANVTAP